MGIFDLFGGSQAMPDGAPQPSMGDRLMNPISQIGLQLLANNGTPRTQGAFNGVPQAATNAVLYQRAAKKEAAETERRNKTLEYLKANNPEIAAMVDSGLDVGDAFNYAMKERQFAAEQARLSKGPGPTSDMQNFQFAQQNPGFNDYLNRNSTSGRLSTQPIYGTDADGNTVLGQLSNDGRFVPSNLPQGVQPLSPYGLNQQKAAGTAQGKSQGESAASLPGAEQSASYAISKIDDVLNDPDLGSATGWQGALPSLPGTTKKNVDVKIAQLKGQTFLQAFESLKGAGQISEVEGQKAEAAIARLDQAQGDDEFRAALLDLRSVVANGLTRSRQRAGAGAPAAQPQSNDLRSKYGLE